MTKLTNGRLEKLQDNLLQFQDSYSDPADKENYDIFVDALHVLDEFKAAKEKLLAYEQAADRPVGEIFRCSGNKTLRWWNDVPEGTVLYAAPVLPKQPVKPVMFIDGDISSDDAEKLAALIREFALDEETEEQQNEPQNIPENIPAQPVIPEQRQMVPDEIIPDQDNTYEYVDGWNACRSEMLKAQPVSEPYKLISVKDDTPTESGDYWCYLGKDFESPTKYRVVHFDVRHHEFQDHRVTHWMRLPAEPEREA